MAKGLFIIGTDTDVGKTVISAGLMHLLRSNGHNACYFKPALSGAIQESSSLIPGDTRFVKLVSGLNEPEQNITPYVFRDPVSPHLASRRENTPIDVEFIKGKLDNIKSRYDYTIIEGSGGLAVPLVNTEYMFYHLIKDLRINCVIIARAGLGTINHTFLTAKFAESIGVNVKGIIFNGYLGTPAEDDNFETLKKLLGIPVIGVIPGIEGIDVNEFKYGNIKETFAERIKVDNIIKAMSDF